MSATPDYAAVAEALRPFVEAELARRSLLWFSRRMDSSFQCPRHLALMIEKLEAVERGEIRRLAICLPPRHGKTELVSRKFVAWLLGRRPKAQVILASYAAELAEMNSRAVRTMLEEPCYPFETGLRPDSRSAGRWQTSQGGVLMAVGVGSGVTGFGGDLVVADDLVKGREEAESEAIRASTGAWFSDVLRTRLQPNGAIVIVGTRWHEDDVLGRVLTEERWDKVILPLVAEEDDRLGRAPGEWLWPGRFGIDDIPNVDRGEISSRSFAALYQQRPAPAEGALFKYEWFANRYTTIPREAPAPGTMLDYAFGFTPSSSRPNLRVQAIDCASKTGVSNDWSVVATVESDRSNYYVVDVDRRRVEFADLCRMVLENYKRHRPSRVYIEDASAGSAVLQELRRATNVPIIPLRAKASKIARAEAVTGLFEAGKVRVPQSAPWVKQFIEEMCRFPAGRHDDVVDAVTYALNCLLNGVRVERRDEHWARQLNGVSFVR